MVWIANVLLCDTTEHKPKTGFQREGTIILLHWKNFHKHQMHLFALSKLLAVMCNTSATFPRAWAGFFWPEYIRAKHSDRCKDRVKIRSHVRAQALKGKTEILRNKTLGCETHES